MNIFRFALSWLEPAKFVILYHHGASGTQKMGTNTAAGDQGTENKLAGQAQNTLSQFEGPVQQSPFYKALLTQGTESTSNAYNGALTNMRSKANQAGFGYTQPVEQGAESQLGAQEASALAQVPNQAMLQAAGPAMQAAGQTAQMGESYGNQGANYYSSAANQDMQRQKSGLWNNLWNLYGGAAQGAGAAMAGGF